MLIVKNSVLDQLFLITYSVKVIMCLSSLVIINKSYTHTSRTSLSTNYFYYIKSVREQYDMLYML